MRPGFTLARWFVQARQACAPADEMERIAVLREVSEGTARAEVGKTLFVKTRHGVCMMDEELVQGARLVWFHFVHDSVWDAVRFWMNKGSVEGMLERVHRLPCVDAERLFVHGE